MDYMKEFVELTEEEAEVFIRDSINWELRDRIKDKVEGTVLDVGCGNGNDSGRYSPDNYMGIDISSTLLKAAKKMHPNHTFLCCDASEMPFEDGQFSTAFCVSLLEHLHSIKDTRDVLKEMVRVASRKVIISWHKIPSETSETKISSHIDQTNRHFGHKVWSNCFNTAELISGIIDKDQISFTKCHNECCIWEIRK